MQCCSLLLSRNHFACSRFLLFLSLLLWTFLAFFFLWCFSLAINPAEFCGHLKEGMSSQIYMISCVFFPHDCLSSSQRNTIWILAELTKIPFCCILECFPLPIFEVFFFFYSVTIYANITHLEPQYWISLVCTDLLYRRTD